MPSIWLRLLRFTNRSQKASFSLALIKGFLRPEYQKGWALFPLIRDHSRLHNLTLDELWIKGAFLSQKKLPPEGSMGVSGSCCLVHSAFCRGALCDEARVAQVGDKTALGPQLVDMADAYFAYRDWR